jgi:hypothetical protein
MSAPKLPVSPIVGGNIRPVFTLPQGFTEDSVIPKDCYCAKVSVSTDHEGVQRHAFLYLVKAAMLRELRRKARALMVAVHNDNVASSDHKLLARRHRQGLR